MPEGDVVFRTAARLHQALAAAPLTRAELRWGALDASALVGRVTLEVTARGKHLLHRVDGGWTVHSHLRMEGSWRVVATREPAEHRAEHGTEHRAEHRVTRGVERGRSRPDPAGNPQVRAVFGTRRWTCLGLRLGMLDLVRTTDEHAIVGHLGPDLLGPDWDAATALGNLRAHPDVPIGQALLDQRLLAGIGTMYAAETLFLRRTYPWTPVGAIADDDLARLIGTAKRLLTVGAAQVVQSTTGSTRRGEEVSVHARSGRPCLRCGDTIRVAPIGEPGRERTMFSCPTCQGGLAPGDDGTPQRPLGTGARTRPGTRERR